MPRKPNAVSGVFEKHAGSGVWYIRYSVDGKNVRKMIGTRAQAIDALHKVRLVKVTNEGRVAKSGREETLTQDEINNPPQSERTVSQLCDDYLKHIQDPKNRRRPKDQINPPIRLNSIKKALGPRIAAYIKPYEVEDWLKSLDKKPGTLNRYRSTFSSVYRYAKGRAVVSVNPVRDTAQFPVELPNPRWLQPDEEEKLRSVLDGWIRNCPENQPVKRLFLRCHPHELTVALGTGMRKSNQYAIKWSEHVDLPKRNIYLPPSLTKTGKAQNIPIIDDVYEALVELREIQREIAALRPKESTSGESERMRPNGRVFIITENREWWKMALSEAGIEDLRWHDLRHTAATRMVAAGVHLRLVQKALGHGSITTTNRYAHVLQSELNDAMSNLNRTKLDN